MELLTGLADSNSGIEILKTKGNTVATQGHSKASLEALGPTSLLPGALLPSLGCPLCHLMLSFPYFSEKSLRKDKDRTEGCQGVVK